MTPIIKTKRTIGWNEIHGGKIVAGLPNGELWTFSRPGGRAIYCDFGDDNRIGTLGRQICRGGQIYGDTLESSDQTFLKVVQSWMRRHWKETLEPMFEIELAEVEARLAVA